MTPTDLTPEITALAMAHGPAILEAATEMPAEERPIVLVADPGDPWGTIVLLQWLATGGHPVQRTGLAVVAMPEARLDSIFRLDVAAELHTLLADPRDVRVVVVARGKLATLTLEPPAPPPFAHTTARDLATPEEAERAALDHIGPIVAAWQAFDRATLGEPVLVIASPAHAFGRDVIRGLGTPAGLGMLVMLREAEALEQLHHREQPDRLRDGIAVQRLAVGNKGIVGVYIGEDVRVLTWRWTPGGLRLSGSGRARSSVAGATTGQA